MRIPKKQKLPKYSNWKRLYELQKPGIYTRRAQSVPDFLSKNGLSLAKLRLDKNFLVCFYLNMHDEYPHEVFLPKFWICVPTFLCLKKENWSFAYPFLSLKVLCTTTFYQFPMPLYYKVVSYLEKYIRQTHSLCIVSIRKNTERITCQSLSILLIHHLDRGLFLDWSSVD